MKICWDFFIICEDNERAGQGGEKKIFPAGTARALGGSLARREYLFPHQALFGSTYLPLGRENSLFSGRTPREALLGRENSTFSGRSCHKVPFPLDRLWFFARLSTQSWLSLDGGSAGDRCVERIRAGGRSGRRLFRAGHPSVLAGGCGRGTLRGVLRWVS